WIRAQRAKGNRLPIVFVSAFWRDTATHRLLTRELGVTAILHKPLNAAALVEEVCASVRGARPGLELPLQSLRGEFLPALLARLRELGVACAPARDRPDDPIAQAAAFAGAHSLFGTAGSYGFDDVAQPLGRLQDLLRLPTPLSAACWSLVALAVAEAR